MARLNNNKVRVGIFGGTFDPLHIAHLILADEASYTLSLDQVLWMLTPNPPHKTEWEITPVDQRLSMLESSVADNPNFIVSRIDVTRPAPHFAVDTMSLLREEYPESKFFYLMGGDSLHDLPTWERPREFIDKCDGFGVMRRPDDDVDIEAMTHLFPEIRGKIKFVEAPLLSISAREIRKRVKLGKPYRYFVPGSVFELIQKMNLYR
jgi:nicotinate-nucleotide adenylyltransferase